MIRATVVVGGLPTGPPPATQCRGVQVTNHQLTTNHYLLNTLMPHGVLRVGDIRERTHWQGPADLVLLSTVRDG